MHARLSCLVVLAAVCWSAHVAAERGAYPYGTVCQSTPAQPPSEATEEDSTQTVGVLLTAGNDPRNTDPKNLQAINEDQLESMIDTYIPDFQGMFLAFTQCYAGDWVDRYEDREGVYTVAGNPAGKTTAYGGFHRGLAYSMRPGEGRDVTDVFWAARDFRRSSEAPWSRGPALTMAPPGTEGLESRHILFYAGAAERLDLADLSYLRQNFRGQPNTTITAVVGNGTGYDHPATLEGLRSAFEEIGEQMNENEQFILFVGDHGTYQRVQTEVQVPGPEGGCGVTVTIPEEQVQEMLSTPENDPFTGIMLHASTPPSEGDVENLSFELKDSAGFTIFSSGYMSAGHITVYEPDLNGNETLGEPGEGVTYYSHVPENTIIPSFYLGGDVSVHVWLSNFSSTGGDPPNVTFDTIGFFSGPIQRERPENEATVPTNALPDATEVVAGAPNAPALQMTVNAPTEGLDITGLTISASGTGNDAEHIATVSAHVDEDGDGVVDDGDTLLTTGSFTEDNGTLELTFETSVPGSLSSTILLSVTFADELGDASDLTPRGDDRLEFGWTAPIVLVLCFLGWRRRRTLCVALFTAGLLLGSCSGDEQASESGDTDGGSTDSALDTATEPVPDEQDTGDESTLDSVETDDDLSESDSEPDTDEADEADDTDVAVDLSDSDDSAADAEDADDDTSDAAGDVEDEGDVSDAPTDGVEIPGDALTFQLQIIAVDAESEDESVDIEGLPLTGTILFVDP